MDTFDIKLEKRKAILKHRQLCNIANLLRFIEVCVVLVLISRFTTQLPVAVKNSGEYFRGLSVVLVSPCFVFIVGNAIVITLFAKAGQFSAQDSASKRSGTDLYEEFVKKSEKSHAIHRCETEYREKQSEKTGGEKKIVSLNVRTPKGTKNYRKSQSENLKRVNCNKACHQLRRSESENYRKDNDSDEKMVKSSYPEDGMSNEQFRKTVEAFIARQKILLREEEYSMIWTDLE
ncbi:uncharacterized protein LOC111308848 [Durio zibethinus]|uniref:Uncharacterized protein LOC111308848 n=1 Tax=Durio zibethinus TaxID=66656 RepID=A0A6P6AEE2_DURZI|nr:uncharacterized protein LOC111308848 [Durio zibethinus]